MVLVKSPQFGFNNIMQKLETHSLAFNKGKQKCELLIGLGQGLQVELLIKTNCSNQTRV
jgi:hypothetical protein